MTLKKIGISNRCDLVRNDNSCPPSMNMIQRIKQLGLDVWLFMRPLINKSSRWGPVGADMTGREQTDQFLIKVRPPSLSLPGRISGWLSNKTKPPRQRCRYPSPTCLAGVSFILKFLAFSLSLSINSDRDEPPTHFSVWLDARFGRCNSEWLCQVAKQARNFFGNFKSAKVHTTTKCKLVLTSFWQLWGKATKRWVQ